MKALFVGLGGVGQRHLRNLKAIVGDNLDVSAYRTRGLTKEISNTLEVDDKVDINSQYGIRVFDDLDAALNDGPDAVFICNPTSLHIPVALAAAKRKCHLFIEKALSHSFDGVAELVRVVEENNLAATVAYQMRFNPCLNALKDILESGALGNILAVNAEVGEYMPGWHKYEDYRSIYAAKADLGGGVIVSQIHEFDYILWLFGMQASVYALGGHLSDLDIDVEDVASVSMNIPGKTGGLPVHLHQDYLQRPVARGCKVIGDRGRVTVNLAGLTVEHVNAEGQIAARHDFTGFDRNRMFIEEIRRFLECIAGTAEPTVPIRDAAASLAMALAAKKSIETGLVVPLASVLPAELAQ